MFNMKVVTAEEMSRIEKKSYSEGASEVEYMENAGKGVAKIVAEYEIDDVLLLCGKGNNAGDAYVAGRYLLEEDCDVAAYQSFPIEECSRLCQENYKRFVEAGGRVITSFDDWPEEAILVDGLLGTGFRGSVCGHLADVITRANETKLPVVAIDVPSGLNGNTGEVNGEAIRATDTVMLGLPKIGCFIKAGWNYVGNVHHVNFGLDDKYIDLTNPEGILLSNEEICNLLPTVVRNRHKYSTGYVVGLAGSRYMPGAAILSGLAALRSGAGIVKIVHPDDTLLPAIPYELVKEPYSNYDDALNAVKGAHSVFLGPGIGLSDETKDIVVRLCNELQVPCVIDADALNILAENDVKLPKNTILTPHIGEMHRLLRLKEKELLSLEFLCKCREYCDDKDVVIILKGGPSFVFVPGEVPIISYRGDPGMATAGSGDVLTGVVAALLSQGLDPRSAAVLGDYIHGLAGEEAAFDKTSHSMIASDIIKKLPTAFGFVINVLP